tara:strand:- start:2637 stop:2894 length:258 start_codon:yes stop_codon:yes gene_type:complete
MLNKIFSILQFLIILIFVIIINYYYFSDSNVQKINKNRINLEFDLSKNLHELPLLKNDTNNIIEYLDDDTSIQKIKKRSFWDLLK